MIARGGKGEAFGGWCFSKARRRNMAHVEELHLPPPSSPQPGGDGWRAAGLLLWGCGAEVLLLMAALLQAHAASLWSAGKQSRAECLGPDVPKGQCSAISLEQLVLKRCCHFVKTPGSEWVQGVDLFIQNNSLTGKQDNPLSGRCCRHQLRWHRSALRQTWTLPQGDTEMLPSPLQTHVSVCVEPSHGEVALCCPTTAQAEVHVGQIQPRLCPRQTIQGSEESSLLSHLYVFSHNLSAHIFYTLTLHFLSSIIL